jgi:hypothetical protein
VRQRGDTQGKVMPMASAIELIQTVISEKR